MKVLVTGSAGFIGYHLGLRLLRDGIEVVGVDNLCDYYDVRLKEARLARLLEQPGFSFSRLDVCDLRALEDLLAREQPSRVIHLAAWPGARHSLKVPQTYYQANILGFTQVLEACRRAEVEHLVYASSSSVYGPNNPVPFSVSDSANEPVSFYALTKRVDELLAHTWSTRYGLPATGLRFFTVYGPYGRPDMAYFLFTRAICEGRPIDVFNHGDMRRDFTWVGDIVEGVARVADRIPVSRPGAPPCPIYNIGNHRAEELTHLIGLLEQCLGRKAEMRLLPMQPGDVLETCANVDDLVRDVGFQPSTPLEEGIPRFVDWYREFYGV